MEKKKNELSIRSSAAEYLTFVAAAGDSQESIEMRYEDENIWLTQKMMAELYAVETNTINEHIKKIFADGELSESATIRKFRIVQMESKRQVHRKVNPYNLQADDLEVLKNPGAISSEIAKEHAETEFEKYRIVQDRLYQSDYDRFLEEGK